MIPSHRSIAHGLLAAAVQALFFTTVARAEPWTRACVDALPDEAFAVVHLRPDGSKSRHLPHHDADGRLDLPHLRSALARLDLVHWEDPANAARARQHLLMHRKARPDAPRVARGERDAAAPTCGTAAVSHGTKTPRRAGMAPAVP